MKHNVLKGLNFTGLPFKSTFEPLHIIDNVKYDATHNKKDLWILLQDMSKAYDHVNIFMLIKALERLHIPFNFLRFILKMFGNRHNQIFTLFGNTDSYKVISGIDQGEIISPLLWCIYYDPLLCRIQNSAYGYSLTHSWKPNILYDEMETMTIKTSALAYMDDTLWIAKFRDDLNNIINIAESFYRLNHIKVNWDKSVLLINNSRQNQPLICDINGNLTKIDPLSLNDSTRYLGLWISLGRNKTFTIKLLQNEIKNAVNIMFKKWLTDKQLVYIFNTVLTPRLEYRAQTIALSERQCDAICSPYQAFMKKS